MVKWIIGAILLLPVAEIAAFMAVGWLIGFGWAFALTLATTIAGFLLLRRGGRGRLTRFRTAVAETDVAGFKANASGFLAILAGILLFLPGFLTDIAGALLLVGPVRRGAAALLRRIVAKSGARGGSGGGRGTRDRRAVIDLKPDEWRQLPDESDAPAGGGKDAKPRKPRPRRR